MGGKESGYRPEAWAGVRGPQGLLLDFEELVKSKFELVFPDCLKVCI